jgi:hypothetical protein
VKSNIPSHETFSVSPEDKQRLLESIAEADRGEFVDADQLLAELDEPLRRNARERGRPARRRKSR